MGAAQIGVSAFDSADFTVTAGFVQLAGGAAVVSFLTDDGAPSVDPNGSGEIQILGINGITTAGQGPGNTITVSTDGTIATTYTTDAGNAIPTAGIINILGQTEFLSTTGIGNTVTTNITSNFEDTAMHGWNGSIIETAEVTVSSDGATITFSVEKNGGGNLTVVFSDGFYDWTTAPATIALTPGTDTSPQINYVYFLQSTKTLTVSTVSFPAAEYAPLATVICESAATLQTKGSYKVHAWTDHISNTVDQGHIPDINFWIREQNATWSSGVDQTYTITTNAGSADNVVLTTLAGVVLQLHTHTFPAFAGTPDYYVINDSVTPYTIVTDLNALLTDSAGVSMSGKYFSLVIWGVVSEDTGDCKLFVNLPSGSYNNASGVTSDSLSYANYQAPSDYKGTAFLISEWKLRHQVAASGTWTSIDEIDLRGFIPSTSPTGSTPTPNEFADNLFRIFDDGDDTKKIAFQASGITTATVRTITMIDGDLDLNTVSNSFPTDSGTATPTANALSILGGTNVSTKGAGTVVTINSTGFASFSWTEVTVDTAMSVNSGYIANKAATALAFTLPATAAVGDILRIAGKGATLWTVVQAAGQTIHFGSTDTTTGAGGSLASTNTYDSIEWVCTVADTDFTLISSIGNFIIT